MSEKNYELKIIKVPLGRSIKSHKPRFPPLRNLELNLLENPKLLKSGVRLIPITPIKSVQTQENEEETEEKHSRKKEKRDKHSHRKRDELDDLVSDSSEDELDSESDSESEILIPKKRKRKQSFSEDELDLSSDSDISDSETESESSESEDESDDDQEPSLSPEEIEAAERKDLLRKLKILRKQYPNRAIPLFDDEFADVKSLKKTYDDEMWDIHIDESVESYRVYFMMTCMGMEYIGTQWFGLDLSGLASHHIKRKEKYDRLLIELGEKSYSRLGSDLPVEIRLLGVMLLETLAFYIGKQISSKGDIGVSQLFSMMTGTAPQPSGDKGFAFASESRSAPRRGGVRGPTISVEEIRSMNKED